MIIKDLHIKLISRHSPTSCITIWFIGSLTKLKINYHEMLIPYVVVYLASFSCAFMRSKVLIDRFIVYEQRFMPNAVVTGNNNSFRQLYSTYMPKWLIDKCEKEGFMKPTLCQEKVLPAIFNGADIILQSQTGSGKTLAYALPILSNVDPSRAAVQAVVIVPTRELGLQVASVLRQLASGSPERILIMTLVDGSQNRRQQLWAVAEPPHIVVGNPQSIERLLETGRLKLGAVSCVVLDEVDACLINTDTRKEVHDLLSRRLSTTFLNDELDLSNSQPTMLESLVYTDLTKDRRDVGAVDAYKMDRQTIMCSATIPQRQHFAAQCFQNKWTEKLPQLFHVSAEETMPAQLVHEYVEAEATLRLPALRYLIRKEFEAAHRAMNEDSDACSFQAIVFVDPDTDSDNLSDICSYALQGLKQANGLSVEADSSVVYLSESLNLDERASAIARMRDGTSRVLVCSDVGSRGIDIPNVSVILQMSLPSKVDNYVHRAGRAGRLGRAGKVITITKKEEDFVVQRFSNELGVGIVKRQLKVKR